MWNERRCISWDARARDCDGDGDARFRRAAGPYAHGRKRRRAKGRRVIAGALDSGDIEEKESEEWERRTKDEGESTMGNRGHRHIIFSETRPCEWTASQGRAHRGKFFLFRFLSLSLLPLFISFSPILQSGLKILLRLTSMNGYCKFVVTSSYFY